jgi:hypothetical protein
LNAIEDADFTQESQVGIPSHSTNSATSVRVPCMVSAWTVCVDSHQSLMQ